MNIDSILSTSSLSKTEVDLIIEIFSNPVVIKYLKIMGTNDLVELATLSITEKDDSEVAKKHALVQGKLSTIVTLLSISNQSNNVKE